MIANVGVGDAGRYFVRITNNVNTVISSDSIVTVNTNPSALFVARTPLSPGDIMISNSIAAAGYVALVQDDRSSVASQAVGKAFVFISSSVDSAQIGSKFTFVAVPVIVCQPGIFNVMFMTTGNATNLQGVIPGQQGVSIYDETHPLAGGLTGTFPVYDNPGEMGYGYVGGGGIAVATATNHSGFPVIFAYEKGAYLAVPPPVAAARRVGLFLDSDGATNLTAQATVLLNSSITWATGAPVTNAPVAITKQPASISVIEGTPATFNVNISGTPKYYIQWRKNGIPLAGGTSRNYTSPPVTAADNGAVYTVFVTNFFGQITSANAVLNVLDPLPIVITSQPDNLSVAFGQTAIFTVGLTGTSPRYQWYKGSVGGGTAVPNATNAILSVPNATIEDSGSYYVVVTNRTSWVSSTSATLYVLAPPQLLMPLNFTWKFNTNAVNIPGFYTNGFDDSSWPTGPAAFCPNGEGLAGGTQGTILPRYAAADTNLQISTVYFRTHFTWSNDPAEVVIVVSNLVDDGAVVYLNGQEIQRIGMPSGTVNYSTYASRSVDVNDNGWDVFTISPYLFNEGDNVFAAEVHQVNGTSSDLVFGQTITAVPQIPTYLSITNQPISMEVDETRSVNLRVGVAGDGAHYQWYHDGVPIPGATRNTLVLPSVTVADAGDYQVVVSNAFSYLVSSKAHLTVVIDTTPPALVLADGSTSATNILVTFTEAVTQASATNIGNYYLTNLGGSTLPIYKIVFPDPTHVRLTTAPREPDVNYVLVASGIADNSPQHNVMLPSSLVPVMIVEHLVTAYSFYDFYNPVPPWDEPCIGTNWMEPEFVLAENWGNNLAEPGAFWLGGDLLPVERGKELSFSSAVTSYFRTWFQWEGSPLGAKLRLRHVVEAGAVFYLNGKELSRFNMPEGPVDCSTFAVSNIISPSWESTEFPIEVLRPGSNLLAVELHSYRASQTTLALAVELDAFIQSLPMGPVVITRQPANRTVHERESVTFDFMAAGPNCFQWYQNGITIPGATNSAYTIPCVPLSLNNSSFSVVASNATSSAISSAAMLTVFPDVTRPRLVSAIATSTNEITVSFTEPLDPFTATNVSHYRVSNSFGVAGEIYGARLENGTNVILNWFGGLGGEIVVTVNGLRDVAQSPNMILPNTAAGVGVQQHIPIDAIWRYNDSGVDLGTNWMLLDYNDGVWATGPGLLYYETAPLPWPKNTLLRLTNSAGDDGVITYYFRMDFISPVAPSNAVFTFKYMVDDGLVLYLNGAEIDRWNMPAGRILANTLAFNSADAVPRGPFSVLLTNLLPGRNVLAAEVHQGATFSSDVVFGLEYTLSAPGFVFPDPPLLEAPQIFLRNLSQTDIAIEWHGAGYALERADALAKRPGETQWNLVGQFDSPTNRYVLPLTNGAGFYRLRGQD